MSQKTTKFTLLKNFSLEEQDLLTSIMEEKTYPSGSFIINEGETTKDLFFIKRGQVKIISRNLQHTDFISLGELSEGEFFGELSFIDGKPRSSSVQAQTETVVGMIKEEKLKELLSNRDFSEKFSKELIISLSSRLRIINQITLSALREKLISSNFTILIISLLTIYVFLFSSIVKWIQELGSASRITNLSMITLCVIIVFFMKKTKKPLSFFGFSFFKIKKSICESVVFTLPILLLITIGKWLIIHYIEPYRDISLFSFASLASESHTTSEFQIKKMLVSYVLISSPLQEVIFRGGLQSLLSSFLEGKYRKLMSIICSNLIFAMIHVVISPLLALFVFWIGLFWGWLYQRHHNIISPIISHCLIGTWAFFILGVQFLFFR